MSLFLIWQAIEAGLAAVRTIALAISGWADACAAPTYEAGIRVPLPGVDARVQESEAAPDFNPGSPRRVTYATYATEFRVRLM